MQAAVIDLRDEEMRLGAAISGRVTSAPQVPSANLRKVMDAFGAGGELYPLLSLADRIEHGDAAGDEAELEVLYENFPRLLNYVRDLTQMCHRREQALAQHGVHIGFAAQR